MTYQLHCNRAKLHVGSFLEEPAKEGEMPKMKGSALMAEASSREELVKVLEEDAYTKGGVWDLAKVCYFLSKRGDCSIHTKLSNYTCLALLTGGNRSKYIHFCAPIRKGRICQSSWLVLITYELLCRNIHSYRYVSLV